MKTLFRIELWVVAALFAAALGAALLLPSGSVVSIPFSDLANQFAPWRAFAAASIWAGHFPLWNPYTYSGEPYFGGFQSALLYPPNAIFLFLPLSAALNFSFFLHIVVLGWGMYRWGRQRGFHPAAAALAGLSLALSGPVWPHLYAGHLSNLCTLAWAPWIFAGFERCWRDRRVSGLAWASGGFALQILAGHMQYAYFTGFAAGLQAIVWSVAEPPVRRRAIPSVLACGVAAAALTAVQLLPGFAAAAESVRQGKMPFVLAGSLSFPVENLLTVAAPAFFGDFLHSLYWGRWYLHEMSLYVGSAALVLAAVALADRDSRRPAGRDFLIAGLLLLIALGPQTPLYRLLYDFVPGIAQFRGISKFTAPAILFAILGIGAGIDRLIRRPTVPKAAIWTGLGLGLGLGLAGLGLRVDPAPVFALAARIRASGEMFLPADVPAEAFQGIGRDASNALLAAAGGFLLCGAALAGARRRPGLRWIVIGLLPIQAILFASRSTAVSPLARGIPEPLRQFISANPGDYRILNVINPSAGADDGFLLGAPDIWGNDPMVPRRYAEFITASQNYNVELAGQDIAGFRTIPLIYNILRLKYVVTASADYENIQLHGGAPDPMGRVELVTGYRVLHGRDALFGVMRMPEFNPRHTVLLESEPSPRPEASDRPGWARVVESSPNELTVEAELSSPAVLLITDSYSRDWRAVALPGSSQDRYELMPADYVLRAVPLAAGHHRLRIEYAPPSLRIGLAISLLAAAGWIGAGLGFARRRG